MLDKFRENSQGIAAKIVLGVVILSFALAGVGGYLGRTTEVAAAVVNGDEISRQALESAYQNERSRMESQYGETFAALASDPNYIQQIRTSVLQRLVAERLTDQAIADLGLRVGDQQIIENIQSTPQFQRDGKFDNDTYLAVLRQAGYQPTQYRDSLRQDLSRQQLVTAYVGSEVSLPNEVNALHRLQNQERLVKTLTVPVSKFVADIEVTDEELQTYYDSNLLQFQSAEKVSVDYVELDAVKLAEKIQLTDEDVKAYYDSHQDNYKRAERRRVAHILVQDEDKAAELLKQLTEGADFVELAKTNSEDTFSGENGGDLGWFEKGVMDPAFEEAAYVLAAKDDLSNVVKSEFGYHVIKLLDVEQSEAAPFDDVKEEIARTLKQDKAMAQFYEEHQQLSELAFEVPDSLDEAADAIGAQVKHSELFSKATASGILANAQVIRQAFSLDLREEQVNSDVIEITPEHIVVLRVNKYEPQSTLPREQVAEEIKAKLVNDKAAIKVDEYVVNLIAELNESKDISAELAKYELAFGEEQTLSRMQPADNAEILRAAFTMVKPGEGQVSRQKVALNSGDIALVELNGVVDITADKAPEEAVQQQLATLVERSYSEADYKALISLLTSKAEISYPTNE